MKDKKARIDLTEYKLRSTWHSIKKMYHEEAKKYGGTHAIGFTLLSIHPKNGTPSTSIGPILGMEANSFSRILKTMEEEKLILRKTNPNDKRGVLIFLTKDGLIKREIAKQKIIKFNTLVNNNVTKKNMDIFFKTTETIKKLASKENIFE
ncbi:MAG: MarR family transcriptional regulator [Flavobacteriaceae bacterium]|nr:MarR family transcriptional regulator [Flavobacteriaceae bacterium]